LPGVRVENMSGFIIRLHSWHSWNWSI